MKDRKIKHVLPWGWYQWKGGGDKERVKKGKYGGSTIFMYCNGTMKRVETVLRQERG
jgi:hypothetical protein